MRKEKPYYDIRINTDMFKITIKESDNSEWLNKFYKGNGIRGIVCKKEKLYESKIKLIHRLQDETTREVNRLNKMFNKLMNLAISEHKKNKNKK